jgi:hypothetical protein
MPRVAIMKTKTGFTVYSFDFTENIFAVFEGIAGLKRAIDFCNENKYEIVNIRQYRAGKGEGGLNIEGNKK